MTTIAALLRQRAGDTAPGLRFEDRTWTWADVVQGWVEALVGAGHHVGGTAVTDEQQLAHLLLVDERAGLGDRL